MIDGIREGALLVRVTAAPVDGAANAAIINVLARAFAVPRSSIDIVKGNRARNKIVSIRGITREQVEKGLAASG
jgi:uncharacterized protein